jgi:hypothetical protein
VGIHNVVPNLELDERQGLGNFEILQVLFR